MRHFDQQESADNANACAQIEYDKKLAKFEHDMNLNRLDAEYSEFIMTQTDARICNGDMLIEAIEGGDYYEDFKSFITEGE